MILRKNLFILILFAFSCVVEMTSAEYQYNSLLLKELKKCFETEDDYKCKEMILLTEKMQLKEYYKGNLKCQTSLLGLQTEIIKNIYFDKNKDNVSGKTISSLIKNC